MATTDIGRVTPIWRGFYSAATTYELNDLVIDNSGSVWWHKSEDQTTGVAPVAGEIWDAVIDMSVFSGLIQAAITTAQTALAAAQEAVAEVTADTERAETAAQNAENSAAAASESAAGVGALAQAAERSAEAAAGSATGAAGSAQAAAGSKSDAEAYAVGKRGGEDVETTDPTYHNNAKYYAEQAASEAEAAAQSAEDAQDVLDSIPEDYSQLSADVGDLKESFEDVMGEPAIVIDVSDLSEYTQYNGNISTSQNTYGNWVNIADNYKHIYIPFSRNTGGTVSLKANSDSASVIAFVKDYVAPISGERPHYSDENGFHDVITVSKGNPGYYNIPSDCYGVILMVKINDTIKTPSEFTLTIPKSTGTLTAQTDENTNDIDALQKLVEADYYDRSSLDGLTANNGNLGDSGNWNNVNANYQHIAVPVKGGMFLSMTALSEYALTAAVLKDYSVPVSGAIPYSTAYGWNGKISVPKGNSFTGILPDDAKYVIIMTVISGNARMPAAFSVTHLAPARIKWLALGDSITRGWYSRWNSELTDTETLLSNDQCYATICAVRKGFSLDNRGIGGSGWYNRGTEDAPKPNIRELLDGTVSDAYLQHKVDKVEEGTWDAMTPEQRAEQRAAYEANPDYPVPDFTQYDVCTVMLGVNDWKGSGSANFGTFSDGANPQTETVIGNMRYFVETAQSRNPALKIILITPVNCAKGTTKNPSSAAINWGIGYEFNGKTLEDYYNALVEVCEYYDIQLVDMLHDSIINRLNAEIMLPDEVHPSLDAHRQIGTGLAGKLQYA